MWLLLSLSALAEPRLGALPGIPTTSLQYCRVYINRSTNGHGGLVLQWKSNQGVMRVDRSLADLNVKEQDCRSNCLNPGKTGVRIFRFQGDGVLATLRKHVSCDRDAEVCSGLPEGVATLTVKARTGRTKLTVHNAYCDI